MTREDFDNLLHELTTEDLTTDRQLEIFSELQADKQAHIDNEITYTENSSKLQDEILRLKRQKVDDFFNKGVEGTLPKEDEGVPQEPVVKSYEEIVANMIKGE